MKYLIFLLSFNVSAATLTWTPPTERMDNTPLLSSEISGYTIFCYQNGVKVVEQSVGNVTAATIDPPLGTSSCNMITIATDGTRSDRSNNVMVRVKPSSPKPPVLQ